jgi:hypothetical protein
LIWPRLSLREIPAYLPLIYKVAETAGGGICRMREDIHIIYVRRGPRSVLEYLPCIAELIYPEQLFKIRHSEKIYKETKTNWGSDQKL